MFCIFLSAFTWYLILALSLLWTLWFNSIVNVVIILSQSLWAKVWVAALPNTQAGTMLTSGNQWIILPSENEGHRNQLRPTSSLLPKVMLLWVLEKPQTMAFWFSTTALVNQSLPHIFCPKASTMDSSVKSDLVRNLEDIRSKSSLPLYGAVTTCQVPGWSLEEGQHSRGVGGPGIPCVFQTKKD